MVDLATFRADAAAWLAANAEHAPRAYGAIVPPDLVDEARAWQRRLAEAGWAGIAWPEAAGGRGLSVEHAAVWLEEAARADVPPFLNMVGFVLMGGTVLAWGTEAQQAEHLPTTLSGERVWCQLFSEPDAGSDLASLATRAELDGDCYVVTGQKVWCSNGRVSDWGILLARTDPDAAKHRGISFFLLDMTLPGVELRPLRQMTGESEFDEVFLDEVRVPADCLVGPLHGGWGVAMSTLTNERGHIGASVISLGRRLDALAATGGSDAVQRDRTMQLLARGRAYQYMGGRQGPVASTAASLMKLGITELVFDLAATGDDTDALLAAPGARIAGGTSQVQRNIIGELLLGLPKEPARKDEPKPAG
jgi:alkylation response protein AidB-like acyl-CoA dehydrogenase